MLWIISTSCMHLLLSATGDPKVIDWDIKEKGIEDYMYSLRVNALLLCSIKMNTLIAISSIIGLAETGWQDKRCRASSYCKHVRLN